MPTNRWPMTIYIHTDGRSSAAYSYCTERTVRERKIKQTFMLHKTKPLPIKPNAKNKDRTKPNKTKPWLNPNERSRVMQPAPPNAAMSLVQRRLGQNLSGGTRTTDISEHLLIWHDIKTRTDKTRASPRQDHGQSNGNQSLVTRFRKTDSQLRTPSQACMWPANRKMRLQRDAYL